VCVCVVTSVHVCVWVGVGECMCVRMCVLVFSRLSNTPRVCANTSVLAHVQAFTNDAAAKHQRALQAAATPSLDAHSRAKEGAAGAPVSGVTEAGASALAV